ncbi:MAG: hypothetical protein A2096_12335 [Spirochaetes bacterium GWF1_41_5]|nr:MAG: hypothetical protein A2096_12335 [Spirochaetes bacterium GWF1_41_5]HBE04519.1 DUF167 domain-containing protein [Spirochaetia bacterium]
MTDLSEKNGCLYFPVKVKASARKSGAEVKNNILVLKVNAPPSAGKANKAALYLLSEIFHSPVSDFSLDRGAAARHKLICWQRGNRQKFIDTVKNL